MFLAERRRFSNRESDPELPRGVLTVTETCADAHRIEKCHRIEADCCVSIDDGGFRRFHRVGRLALDHGHRIASARTGDLFEQIVRDEPRLIP
ncbi:hypothetical protein O4328_35155 [Rhodococcus opacus]|uniref:Transposase n=1 Tax=Rhodococcus opacus TaxID=37919 RepID=A0AAX3YSF2_RHOOP|nr:hypothetical protein [Rhodococcus opacus]MCZ4588829.1 hypothetical protein [Rhodococcus opacus]WLF51866.1 hypothetical protein Q5707_41065 [Rhodococcus opacus]WLF52337.1 hypothetical protein Q5707_43930 [Rhodococcus opacus]